jgi:electron transfer flavoprotein beta subunit
MKIVVCVKQVIDVTFPFELDFDTCLPLEDDIFYKINPSDMSAAATAIKLHEQFGGEIIYVAFGPPRVRDVLRDCIALGGGKAVHLWDDRFSYESYPVEYILSRALEILKPDLIICGSRSIDEGCSEVPQSLAAFLDLPQITGLTTVNISPDGKTLNGQRKLEKGRRMSLECDLPAVISVEPEIEETPFASLPGLLDSVDAKIIGMNFDDLKVDISKLRNLISKREQVRLSFPRPRPKKTFHFDDNLSAEDRMELLMSGGSQSVKSDMLKAPPEELAEKIAQIIEKEVLKKYKN